jgi:hypothetical protein
MLPDGLRFGDEPPGGRTDPFEEDQMANKDKGGAKNKKAAGKTLKEKRAAKKAKGKSGGSTAR